MVLSTMFINTPKFVYQRNPPSKAAEGFIFLKLKIIYNKIMIYFFQWSYHLWIYKFVTLYHCDIFKPIILRILTQLEKEFGMSKRHLSCTVAILPGTQNKAKIDIRFSLQMLVSSTLGKLEF